MNTLPEPQIACEDSEPDPRPPLRSDWRPGMIRLLGSRVDLRGIYPTADYIDEAIRWSA